MVRPLKCRKINITPEVAYFKPRGVPLRELAEVYLPLDGLEAIRLADLEGLSHQEAAQRMHVSRQTFGRILSSARNTVARALTGGLALRIHTAAGQTVAADAAKTENDPSANTVRVTGKENPAMNTIAVTSEGPTLEDLVDPRFGRAAGFIVIDPQTLKYEYVANGEAQVRAQGAGIQAAETVARAGVQAVLTGYVGPKAFQALAAAGIRVAQDLENITVREAVARYNQGALTWSQQVDAKGPRV